MKSILNDQRYLEDLERIAAAPFIPWDRLRGSSLFISGSTGMIGSCLIDAIMFQNQEYGLNCSIHALSRNLEAAQLRFDGWRKSGLIHFVQGNVNNPDNSYTGSHLDYILHLASNTHPIAYATDPIGTITANILGTKNMLDLAVRTSAQRFLFASSNEIYGENRGDTELFDESYLGFIDCNSLRAGYPESKRCGEALCQAYRKQFGQDFVIARLTRSFGPTLRLSDTKALSQFIKNALNGEDIVLKSAGNQFYSYTYTIDAVSGLLSILLEGQSGEAYNIADTSCDITLRDLAAMIAESAGTHVVFHDPDSTESAGFSKATKARLDGRKLRSLGWEVQFSLESALKRTLSILQDLYCNPQSI